VVRSSYLGWRFGTRSCDGSSRISGASRSTRPPLELVWPIPSAGFRVNGLLGVEAHGFAAAIRLGEQKGDPADKPKRVTQRGGLMLLEGGAFKAEPILGVLWNTSVCIRPAFGAMGVKHLGAAVGAETHVDSRARSATLTSDRPKRRPSVGFVHLTEGFVDLTEEVASDAALYALGQLDPESRTRFEARLHAGCQLCRAELAAFKEITSNFALLESAAAPVPPPSLKERLMARVAAETPSPGAAAPSGGTVLRQDDRRWRRGPAPGVEVQMLLKN